MTGSCEQLGRIHAGREIEAAVADLRAAGMDNFNLDLMYALPQQTLGEALHDIQRAIELAPAHVSHYQLTLEAGTPFARHPPSLPDDEAAYDMQLACQERLAAAGYAQYEVSAYARPERRCAHNLNYWQYGDYLGIGAGAHGKLTSLESGRIERTARIRHPSGYLAADPPARRVAELVAVGPGDLPVRVRAQRAAAARRIRLAAVRIAYRPVAPRGGPAGCSRHRAWAARGTARGRVSSNASRRPLPQ